MTDARREIPYDKLVIATGSSPNFLPIQGVSKKGIYAFRTIDDYEAICADAVHYQQAAVIGGGVLGVEVAAGLQMAGLETTIIHYTERLMQRQLDETAAGLLQRQFIRKGIQVKTNAHTIACLGGERVEGVLLKMATSWMLILLFYNRYPSEYTACRESWHTHEKSHCCQ